MAGYTTEQIRNIALVGQAGCGKTTLAEQLLYQAGAIAQPGKVQKGSTVSDYDPQEKALGHSLIPSLLTLDYSSSSANAHINLLDTPGAPDFFGRAVSVLPAVDSIALVLAANAQLDLISERLMQRAAERKLCRLIVINKLDATEASPEQLLERLQQKFGAECLPLNLPSADDKSVVDCYFDPEEGVPTAFSSVTAAHEAIVDQVVEVDEQLMEVYLEQGQALSPAQLHEPFEQALREGHLIPVCFTSAEENVGVKQLLRIIAELMPTPLEANPPQFLKGEGAKAKPVSVTPDRSGHAIAHVFKVNIDPYVGRLSIFRVHQGTIENGSPLFVGDSRKPIKIGHLLKLQGKKTSEADRAIPGDLCAVAKIDEINYDDVLHDSHDEDHFHLKPTRMPAAMYGVAVSPKRRGDEQKLSEALQKMVAEDPSLRLEQRVSLNETVLYGLGELHLRVVRERMAEQFNVEMETAPPSISYRETITRPAEGHHRHKKQTGGAGQFGEVYLRVEPLERGAGFEFVNKVVGGSIPTQFIPAVEKGVRQVLEEGAVAGYPMCDLRVTVYDGKYHSVDSKEVAFVAAGKKAFLDAIEKAKPIILEPMVEMQVTAPSTSVGDITGDLSGARGLISGSEVLEGNKVRISALTPLSELENYPSRLKSMTGGEGMYSMEFSHYEPVPGKIQQNLRHTQ